MDDISLAVLVGLLLTLLLVSAFFSGSETSMMALNRYRMRHRARLGDRSAKRVVRLLQRPDRLLGLILFGNNLVNILAASLATIIAYRLFGSIGVVVVPFVLTAVVLLFAEVAPKTFAVLYPERIAVLSARLLTPLMWLAMPVVSLINTASNGLLRLFGVRDTRLRSGGPSQEELRALLHEAGGLIPPHHRKMLLNILELEDLSVEDVMVPSKELYSINLDDPEPRLREVLEQSPHSRLPVCRGNLEHIVGIINMRDLQLPGLSAGDSIRQRIEEQLHEPYFVPEGSGLHNLLLEFRQRRERVGLIVDEYGVAIGLVTLEDVLEQIIGEFTSTQQEQKLQHQADGQVLADGSLTIHEINRQMGWALPTNIAHTLNGVVLEQLEIIPREGLCLRVGDYIVEVTQCAGNAVKKARIRPAGPTPGRDSAAPD